MRPRSCLFMLVVVALLAVVASRARADTDVFLTIEAVGNQEPRLSIADPATEGEFALFLVNNTDQALSGLTLSATLRNDRTAQLLPSVKIEFLNTGVDQVPASFDVAAQARIPIRLRVSNLSSTGTFAGNVIWSGQQEAANRTGTLSFTLARTIEPRVTIQRTDASRVLALSTSNESFILPLTLFEETGGPFPGTSAVGSTDSVTVELELETPRLVGAAGVGKVVWQGKDSGSWSEVLAGHEARPLNIEGTLPTQGEYTGTLFVRYNNQTTPYTLRLTRAKPMALSIVEAINSRVDLPINSREFSQTLTVALAEGQEPLADLRLSLAPLRRTDGQAIGDAALTCSPCGDPAPQTISDTLPLTLNGDGFITGTYSTTLRLHYQHQSQDIPITISRGPSQHNLSISDPGTVPLIRRWWAIPYLPILAPQRDALVDIIRHSWIVPDLPADLPPGDEVDIPFTITETKGLRTSIAPPRIEYLQLQTDDGDRATVSGIEFELCRREPGGVLQPVSTARSSRCVGTSAAPAAPPSETPDASPAETADASPAEILGLAAITTAADSSPAPDDIPVTTQGVQYVYRIRGLRPGLYNGLIATASTAEVQLTRQFQVRVKDSPLWAFLIILVGVVASRWVRGWQQSGRQRWLRSAAIAEVRDTVQKAAGSAKDEHRPTWSLLLQELNDLETSSRYGAVTDITDSLKLIARRVTAYSSARDLADKIWPILAEPTFKAAQGFQSRLEQHLKDLQDAVRAGNADQSEAKLADLRSLYDEVRVAVFKETVAALLADVQAFKDDLNQRTMDQAIQARAQALEDSIKAIQAETANMTNLDQLRARLHQLSTTYNELRLDDLELSVALLRAEIQARPQGDPLGGEVGQLLNRVEDVLDRRKSAGSDPTTLWPQARDLYLDALMRYLEIVAGSLIYSGTGPGLQTWNEAQKALTAALGAARQARTKGDYETAKQQYDEAQKHYRTLVALIQAARLDEALTVLRDRPVFVEAALWPENDAAWQDIAPWLAQLPAGITQEQQSAINKIAEVGAFRARFAHPETLKPQQLQTLRRELAIAQIEALKALYTWINSEPTFDKRDQVRDELESLPRATNQWATGAAESLVSLEAAVDRALVAYRALLSTIRQVMQGARQGPGAAADAAATPPVAAPAAVPTPAPSSGMPAFTQITDDTEIPPAGWSRQAYLDEIARRDSRVLWISIVTAALTGLTALWLPNGTWGGLLDYITAFLWGFGTVIVTSSALNADNTPSQ